MACRRRLQVSALEAQLAEVLAVSERKAMGASELADARVAAAQAEAQARISEMAVSPIGLHSKHGSYKLTIVQTERPAH